MVKQSTSNGTEAKMSRIKIVVDASVFGTKSGDDVAFKGDVILHREGWSSGTYTNPTVNDVIGAAEKSAFHLGDHHHIYLESAQVVGRAAGRDADLVDMRFGS
jgi:hypothetical protein